MALVAEVPVVLWPRRSLAVRRAIAPTRFPLATEVAMHVAASHHRPRPLRFAALHCARRFALRFVGGTFEPSGPRAEQRRTCVAPALCLFPPPTVAIRQSSSPGGEARA